MSDLATLFASSRIQMVLILIAIDIVLGIIGALAKKEFTLGKLAGFMKKGIIGYVLGLAVLGLVKEALPGLSFIATLAYYLVLASLIGSILGNLKKIGLPVPNFLGK